MAAKDLMCIPDDDPYQPDWKGCRSLGQDEFVLTKVMGLTNISKNALDCNQATGYVAFPASCMLVLLDPKTNDQKFIKSPSGKSISCVTFSDDGRLVAMGEGGVKPFVSVWSLKDHKELGKFMVDHSVGVKTIAIHPKSTYVVLIGIQDLNIGVWDYMRCQRLALTKWQTVPLSLTIPKSGSSVILCGHRKITLFNLDKVSSNCYETNVFEEKKAVLLGRQSEYTFVDITSGKGKFDKNVYTVTTSGYLCEIRLGDILIDKAIKVGTHAYCVRFALNHVFIGCCEGVVKICIPDTLNVAVAVSLDQLLGADAFPQAASKLYLDTTAIAVNEKDSVVTCIYANCSIYSWQINSFSENIECSVLLPSGDDQLDNVDLESCISESACKANMFRSLMGCLEFTKESRLFDTETLAARNGLRCHHDLMHLIKGNTAKNQHVTSFRFSPDGRDVICGNEAGEIKVYDACTGVLRRVIEAHSAQVMCIELLYDEEYQLVCTGGRDRIIFILNAKSDFSLVQVLCDHSAAITAISLVSHDGLLTLVSAAADNLILVRRAAPGNSLKFTVTGQIVESRCNKALNVTGDYIITGDKNGNIKLFKADPIFNPKLSKTLKTIPKGNQITSVPKPMCIDPTGSFIAAAQNSGQIVIYHLPTGQAIASISAQIDATAIKFTSCLKFMISSTANGCTMVWKVPERMAEFMIAKRNKSNQIEIAKEVSYETTYVSCVKVCKETSIRESSREICPCDHKGPDSNHNYDTDATPSIESLSFLRMAHKDNMESEGNSLCSTDSYISCSTCRDSYSDTVHWCPSSNSSAQTNSAIDCFCFGHGHNVCDRIVEDSECKKLGPFKHSDYDMRSEQLAKGDMSVQDLDSIQKEPEKSSAGLSDNSENNKSQTVTGAVQDASSNKALVCENQDVMGDVHSRNENAENFALVNTVPRTANSDFVDVDYKPFELKEKVATMTTEMMTTNIKRVETMTLFSDSVNIKEGQGQRIDSIKTAVESIAFKNPLHHQKNQSLDSMASEDSKITFSSKPDSGNLVPEFGLPWARKQWGITPSSPLRLKKICSATSPISVGSYKTACSPKPTTSKDTSCSPGNSIFFSPSPCFSSEEEDTGPRLCFSELRLEADDKERDKASGVPLHECDKFKDNFSSNIQKPLNDQSMTLEHSGILSKLFTRETGLDDPLLRNINKPYQTDKKLHEDNMKDIAQIASSACGNPQYGCTSLGVKKPRAADGEVSVSYVRKNESSGRPCEIVSLAKHNMTDTTTGDKLLTMEVPLDAKFQVHRGLSTLGGTGLISSEISDDEAVYNYHSISRDASGKLILVARNKKSFSQSAFSQNMTFKSSPNNSVDFDNSKVNSVAERQSQEHMLQNIQCSRCSHKDETNSMLVHESGSESCKGSQSASTSSAPDSNIKLNDKAKELPKQDGKSDALSVTGSQADGTQREFIKGLNDQKLEEYFSELRKCLQLTNSQETVYRLACDVHDHEFMELLEFVLKKRPSTLMETFPPSQLEIIRRNLADSDSNEQHNLHETVNDRVSSKIRSPCTTIPASNKELDVKSMLQSTTLTTQNTRDDKCGNVETDVQSQCSISQSPGGDESSQRTAKAIINLVGQLLTSRRTAQEQWGRQENNQVVTSQCLTDLKSNGGHRPLVSMTSQQKSEKDSQSFPCQNHPVKSLAQQYMMRTARNDNRHLKSSCKLEVLKEGGEDSDSLSDISLTKTRSTVSDSRHGLLSSSRLLDSGIDSSINEKHSYTKISQSDETEASARQDHDRSDATSISVLQEKDGKVSNTFEKLPKAYTAELPRRPPKSEKDGLCLDAAKVQEESKESRMNSNTGDRKYPPPIVELFRDQDEYLKKLKEVREKFEMSIQALSKERKSRLAEEERLQNK